MTKHLIAQETIERKIHSFRGKKVMLDRDLAELYGVSTGNLNLAVRRNINRFPEDFMFQLTRAETKNLILQSARSRWGGTRKFPYAFTEQGVAMLSSVLNSGRAIEINILIMRTFIKLKEVSYIHRNVLLKLNALEKKIKNHDENIESLFEAIRQLIDAPKPSKHKIGFVRDN
ncbi:MAG: hypothetical protein A3B80_01125 [Elusimicrobia bacterium RIFCSPHIGHO2_02_FULL_39_36]|nr:MAG: hypothetical protein A3B80_01125 [Elusimicrobia bacterium RIFCSPHIGHO2_02_FULL_39_36]